ncbi:glycosyltransferase [Larkinella rosea]|uniref:Glycosyltransferase n=1 Tax=Larkinella rosea TaxID=2025312 RepID=A0A3P1BUT6_9BACT|nr:glycosyltransferase [Larkinella rosea]RRB04847.1 glycosyltransferase [Larkinella rosea]
MTELSTPADRINIIIPLFNDWEAVSLLLDKIVATVEPAIRQRFHFLIVDDCSVTNYQQLPMNTGQSLSILRLWRNVGHQKAIALGLSYLADQPEAYTTIVMDSDGEDKPEDIARLLDASLNTPGQIIFAHRTKRQESRLFKTFYQIYKTVFKLLTGKAITFGNFSAIPPTLLRKLAHVSDIWNNYPGGVIRSRLPYRSIPLERGLRLAGQSKMNFVSLILHGLSAIAVLMEATAVRIFLFCIITASISSAAIAIVVLLRFTGQWTISGWASYIVFSLFIVILQAFLISLLLVFIVLTYRTQSHFIPAKQYKDFIERVEVVY